MRFVDLTGSLVNFRGYCAHHPSSVRRVIVHVGTATQLVSRQSSSKDFKNRFDFISSCEKSIYISGPIPSLGCGVGHFSRLLSLDTWIQSTCTALKFGFIDNFNLFWDRSDFFRPDGMHQNWRGNQMLAANLQHTVQSDQQHVHHDCLPHSPWNIHLHLCPLRALFPLSVPPAGHICHWYSHQKFSQQGPYTQWIHYWQ